MLPRQLNQEANFEIGTASRIARSGQAPIAPPCGHVAIQDVTGYAHAAPRYVWSAHASSMCARRHQGRKRLQETGRMTRESWKYVCIYSLGLRPAQRWRTPTCPLLSLIALVTTRSFLASTVYGFRPWVWVTSGTKSHSYLSGPS